MATKKKHATLASETASKKTASVGQGMEPRQITPESYASRIKRVRASRKLARNRLPGAARIFYRSVRILFRHWNVIGGVLLVYTLINLLLIGGFSSGDSLTNTKDSLADVFTGNLSQLTTGLALFSFLVQSGSSVASGAASAYQTVVLILVSLAFVWAIRQLYAGNKIRIRDAFYQSTYPLVPVILVLLMLAVQLLPGLAGLTLFNLLVVNGIILVLWQQVLVGVACLLLVFWTFYMLTASLFAVYIATLPDMTPLAALRSAKDIVKHRRGMVLWRLIFLPLILLILAALVMVPLSIFATTAATAVFFLMTVATVPVVHSYMYTLYRELINA